MLDLALIRQTKELIQGYVHETPLDPSICLSKGQTTFYFKNEGLQHTKSFKLRGAFSKLLRLTQAEKEQGIVAVSSGNHGIAVSYVSAMLGIDKVLIFVPENTPAAKTEKIRH